MQSHATFTTLGFSYVVTLNFFQAMLRHVMARHVLTTEIH